MTAFLDCEKYHRIGLNTGNSRNIFYEPILCTEFGELQLVIYHNRNGKINKNHLVKLISFNPTPLQCKYLLLLLLIH
ncbi:hypothetical protein [Priestia megaterium]|uniref:hypothetical protein n=1 Tax=Priestia TaxID=2800373 RepID=UPI0039A377FE